MSGQKLVCDSPSLFESTLSEALSTSASSSLPLFVLFYGEKLPATGKSWCPDCVVADPIIEHELSELPSGYVLLECPVVREEYRKSDYPYRTDPKINLRCVPTLFKWGPEGAIASLDDSQSQDVDQVRALVNL